MNKQEADKRVDEIVRLLTEGMRTSEKIAEAYQKLFYFHCDWIKDMKDICFMEIH